MLLPGKSMTDKAPEVPGGMVTWLERTTRKCQGGNGTQIPGTTESWDPSPREAWTEGKGMNGGFGELRQGAKGV